MIKWALFALNLTGFHFPLACDIFCRIFSLNYFFYVPLVNQTRLLSRLALLLLNVLVSVVNRPAFPKRFTLITFTHTFIH